MEDCVFCMICEKKIQSNIIYEDDEILAFKDINPEAPIHILIILKKHIASLMEASEDDLLLFSKVFSAAQKIAVKSGIDKNGFRIVTNCGKDGGQSVNHVHFHLLGGRKLQWPPG